MKTNKTNQSAVVIAGSQEMGVSPWPVEKKAPAKKGAISKAKVKAAAKAIPMPDTRSASKQNEDAAKVSQADRKAPVKAKDKQPRKRGQGESITEHIAGLGEVTVYATDIALGLAAWKGYIETLKAWETAMKEGNDRLKGLKLPKAPTFSHAVEFLAGALKAKMHVPAMGKHKPKKGKVRSNWKQARFALIQAKRENAALIKKEVTPRHERILKLQRAIFADVVKIDRLETGNVRMRTYKNTVGVSANKKDKQGVA